MYFFVKSFSRKISRNHFHEKFRENDSHEKFPFTKKLAKDFAAVTLNVQEGCKLVRTSLEIRGQACVIACMASLESGYGQEAGKVIYYSDGHWRIM